MTSKKGYKYELWIAEPNGNKYVVAHPLRKTTFWLATIKQGEKIAKDRYPECQYAIVDRKGYVHSSSEKHDMLFNELEDEQKSEFVKAVNQAMNNLYEAKVNYPKGSYEDPYLFICSEETAKIIKTSIDIDDNNIFLSNGVYFQLGIQELLKPAKVEGE